jgi:hypothetical protein
VINPDGSSVSLPNALVVEPPAPTEENPEDKSTATPYVRPIVVVETYNAGADSIQPGQDFTLTIRLQNIGGREAVNLIATFTPGDWSPRSGGVLADRVGAGERKARTAHDRPARIVGNP